MGIGVVNEMSTCCQISREGAGGRNRHHAYTLSCAWRKDAVRLILKVAPNHHVYTSMPPIPMYALVLGALAVAGAGYALLRRKKKTSEELERERRTWLNEIGRITDGTVIDVQEIGPEVHRAATMLIYQYDVAGVSYEASQDVTYLRQWINLHSCRLGLPTSVKYDPHNPGNSMVIAEGWTGLRQ